MPPKILVTYHPASLLYAKSQQAGAKGPSKETVLRCLQEDLRRVWEVSSGRKPLEFPAKEVPTPLRGVVALDTEYSGTQLLTVGLSSKSKAYSWDIGQEDPKYYWSTSRTSRTVGLDSPSEGLSNSSGPYGPDSYSPRTELLRVLEPAKILIGHNVPEDLALLWEHSLLPRRREWVDGTGVVDSLLVARMVYEDWPSYELEDLLGTVGGLVPGSWKAPTRGVKDASLWPPEERAERCRLDAWASGVIATSQWRQIDPTLYKFTNRVAHVLHRMSLAGAFVDQTSHQTVKAQLQSQLLRVTDQLTKAARTVGMVEYEPQNRNHTRELLFDRLGLPVLGLTKKTQTPEVTHDTLRALAEEATGGTKVLLDLLLRHAQVHKLYSTYVESLETLMHPQGVLDGTGTNVAWLPFHFNPLGARTGRRSSSKPNSQNWPPPAQHMIRSRWANGRILALDYRKLEPRVVAWLVQSQKLLDFFTTGGGYIDVARELFRTDVKEGTLLYRGVKAIVLGVHYDMQTDKMALELWTQGIRFSDDWSAHWDQTDRIRHLYLRAFPEITQYVEARHAEVAKFGYVTSPTGRRRRLGGKDKHSQNQAVNFPIQSGASDVMGSALIDVEAAVLDEYGVDLLDWYDLLLDSRRKYLTPRASYDIMTVTYELPTLFNEVHDCLLVDLPDSNPKDVDLIVETMRAVPTLRSSYPALRGLPLDVDVKLTSRWGEKAA